MSRHDIGLVVLADRVEPVPSRIVHRVGEAPRPIRRERHQLAGRGDAVEAPGGEVRHDDELLGGQGRRTAVLVDPAAGVEPLRGQPGHRSVGIATHQDLPAALVGRPSIHQWTPFDRRTSPRNTTPSVRRSIGNGEAQLP